MKLGELIEALEDYKLHTIGVDEDTEVIVRCYDPSMDMSVEDVLVTVTRSRNQYTGRHTNATVVLEVAEQ